ncbi:MAG TPA: GPW/gp25 family protein, partial [Phnomibacter sp.]|nr:GPW/gp25 family protein [Phnomibacter sp.]
GWQFPPSFTAGGQQVNMSTGIQDIEQSLHLLLSTSLRERVMQPTYGSNLNAMVFEGVTENFKTYLQHLVKTAITYHEARIKAEKVEVIAENSAEGNVLIVVDYTLRNSNTRYNFVYPFYIQF